MLDLLDTENELFEAKCALVNAEVNSQLAQVRVLTQTHSLLPALQLTPLAATAPGDADLGGAEADDARMACSSEAAPSIVLDRAAAMANRPARPSPVIQAPAAKK